jgi:DNA-binding transcriptional MerR regulator/methylmalonyl-CoA mutase cobalamin-binding subunit
MHMNKSNLLFNIGVVERETGIGKDTLRVWERRYGFPLPVRDEREDRLYPADQVDRLRLIKRLLDSGMRPAKVVGLGMEELSALLTEAQNKAIPDSAELQEFLDMIKEHQISGLRIALHKSLLSQGMHDFLSKTISPLNHLVGDAWMRGEIRVFEEHLYSEQLTGVLRSAIVTIRDSSGSPRVLLTTLPGEEHALGLMMADATLSLCGASCILLGIQTPISEIVLAAHAHEADIVTLSFSSAMPAAQVKAGIEKIRAVLPQNIELWVGGEGAARQRKPDAGIKVMGPLSDLVEAVTAWRAEPR